ncbi:MAG: cation:proton antiporter [Anaerolineales bacterium]
MLQPLHEPVAVFLTIMAVILITPILSERIRLPGIVGLILGGILVGPHVLGLLRMSQTIELLGTIGLVYLMFAAGLEIDLGQLKRVQNKAIVFALFTFTIPILAITGLGRAFEFGWSSAILLGATFASHTLIAYPILSQLGIVRNESIAMVVGATVFTDVASLLVLAVIAGGQEGDFSAISIVKLVSLMVGYAVLVLLGLPRAGKLFFSRFSSRDIEFQFVLVSLFVAAVLAEMIGMHAIVGAFLAGLAINATLPSHSAVGSQVLFLGDAFFIPMFMIYVGMSIDPLAFVTSKQTLLIGLAMTAAVYVTKFAAAWITSALFDYTNKETFAFWGLSQAQAAATIATILVGINLGLFTDSVFNGAILAVLCTSISSPLLVKRFGKHIRVPSRPEEEKPFFKRVLVPIANPDTQEHLLSLANILSQSAEGTLLPLHVAKKTDGDVEGLQHQREILAKIPDILEDPESRVETQRRINKSIADGILDAALETEATSIVMGWRGKPTFRQSIYGTVLDKVIWNAKMPVFVGRITSPINATRQVVLAVPGHSTTPALADKTLETVVGIARAVNAPLLVLTAPYYKERIRSKLEEMSGQLSFQISLLQREVVQEVAARVEDNDLVVITSTGSQVRFRSSLGRTPEELAKATDSSIVTIHYP